MRLSTYIPESHHLSDLPMHEHNVGWLQLIKEATCLVIISVSTKGDRLNFAS